jgi:NAD(P)-dependent dehydrogenase (short-subunit alcohol dehydrogenase family)
MTTRLRREAQVQFGDAERWRELTKGMGSGRAATPQEIAWMAAFLASDKSAYTTGTIVTVDGAGRPARGSDRRNMQWNWDCADARRW